PIPQHALTARDQSGTWFRDVWPTFLPMTDLVPLVEGLSGDDRWAAVSQTRKAQRAWLHQRNLTQPMRRKLLGHFRRMYRVETDAAPGHAKGRVPSRYVLVGQDRASVFEPYSHQLEAWKALNVAVRLNGRGKARGGLLVLPPGAGKTEKDG